MTDGAILVTGAAGLVGHAVCNHLEAAGRKVVAIDRLPGTDSGRQTIACDLTDVHRLHALATQFSIGGIIHCGAHSGPMVARDNPFSMVQVNIVGTANVLELARVHGCSKVVVCSSTSAYGNTPEGPVPEDVPLFPTSVYGASKVASEQLVSAYANQYGLDALALRLSWVYGPRRTTDCVIRTMIEDAQAGLPTRIPFGADFYRQFIHVDDAARALIVAFDTSRPPRTVYTVTGGSYLTLEEIAGLVRKVVPGADIALAPGRDPVDDVQHRFDTSAAERDLGFRPSIGLEDGLRAYAVWLKARPPRTLS